jgi:hypothetical protein
MVGTSVDVADMRGVIDLEWVRTQDIQAFAIPVDLVVVQAGVDLVLHDHGNRPVYD